MSVLKDIIYSMTYVLANVMTNLLILMAKNVYKIVAQDTWLGIL